MSLLCKNTRYDHECHPAYARRYDGYCLECHNAGVRDLVEAIPVWQPISTAPKDGSNVWVVFRDENGDTFQSEAWYFKDELSWMTAYGCEPIGPTHWQPLPTPPSPTPPTPTPIDPEPAIIDVPLPPSPVVPPLPVVV